MSVDQNPPIPFYRSLRFKLVLASILVEITMLGLLLANSVRLLNHTLDEQTKIRVQATTPLLNAALGGPLFARDYTTADDILKKLSQGPLSEFKYIVVYDTQGNVFASAGQVNLKAMPAPDSDVASSLRDMVFDTHTALMLYTEQVGEVRYGLSLQSLVTSRDRLFQQSFFIASAGVALTFLLLSLSGFLLTRHIRILMAGARRVASGDYTAAIPVSGQDEIGHLAADFNAMTAAIRDRIEALHRSEEKAAVTLHSIGDGVITTDVHGFVQYLNPVAEALTGWSVESGNGKAVNQVYHVVDEVNRSPLENIVMEALRKQEIVNRQGRSRLIGSHGRDAAVEETASPIRDRNGAVIGSVLVFRDMTETREMARQLGYQASHDPLTGLINRSEFEREVEAALGDAREFGNQHALCYLDLDQFKVINDTCGHFAGDELLRRIANLIRGEISASAIVGRLGGDEFGILLKRSSLEHAERVALDIRDSVQEFRFAWDNTQFEVGVSIGIVPVRADNANIGEIFSAADVACYAAKDKGRNMVHTYLIGDIEYARRRGEMQWSTRITTALKENRFVLYFQKIVPTGWAGEQDMCHGEILLRMLDEEGKIIPPSRFMSAAERYRHMGDIDRWVVREALSMLRLKVRSCPESCFYSINLSGQSLGSEGLLDFVKREFQRTGLDPKRVCFEITETAAISNLSFASRFITELHDIGCRFALDDFGSGLSSFGYLKALPVDYLKIDGSFVKDMVRNPNDRAMVSAINQIGHLLGIKTIAEFVENEETLLLLRETGVDYAQGYFIHKPEAMRSGPDGEKSVCKIYGV